MTDKPAPTEYDWLPEARQIAAQCWCDDDTQHLVMEPALCEAFARRLAAWMRTGAQHARNEEYWRDRARAALAAAPQPVAWIQPDHLQKAMRAPFLCRVEPTQRFPDFVPLFATTGATGDLNGEVKHG